MFVPHNGVTAGCNRNYVSNTAVVLAKLINRTIIIDDIKRGRIKTVTGRGLLRSGHRLPEEDRDQLKA